MTQDFSSVPDSQGMHQEEHDQRNLGGFIPTNIQMFPHGLVSYPLAHYFSGIELASNAENPIEPSSSNFSSQEIDPGGVEHELWHEQERGSNGGFDFENGSFEMLQSDDKQPSTSARSRVGSSGSSTKAHQKFTKETRVPREHRLNVFNYQDNRASDVYLDKRAMSSGSMPASHTSSIRSKTSSEAYWEESSTRVFNPAREKQGRKTDASVLPSAVCVNGKSLSGHSLQVDDDADPPSILGAEMAERTIGFGPQPDGLFPNQKHQMPGFEEAQTSRSDPLFRIPPFLSGPSSGRRTMDKSVVPPLAFTVTGPPFPFLFCPVCNILEEKGTPDASTSPFSWDEGLDNNDSGKFFESSEGLDQPEVSSTSSSMKKVSSLESSEHKFDILKGDIANHWQNLQYGRFYQNSRDPPMLIYPSPVMVPPVYLQGHFPWDGPRRPLSTNMNLFSQLTSYGPRILPVTPLQSVSNRPVNVFPRNVDEIPRYHSGTGTYLPNPKVPMTERHSANTRRGKYNYDKNGYHGDKEGNWNANTKSLTAWHSHGRNRDEKSRSWGSHKHVSLTSYQSRNGPVCSNPSQSSSASMPYGMYPLPAMNSNGVSSNGPCCIPSVVMLCPYDHNSSYDNPAEQLEFGSLGLVGFSRMNEISQLSDGICSSGVYEQRFRSALHNSCHWTSLLRPPPEVLSLVCLKYSFFRRCCKTGLHENYSAKSGFSDRVNLSECSHEMVSSMLLGLCLYVHHDRRKPFLKLPGFSRIATE
ncbi:uncharacterized protein LOC120189111 [Hibiscus syriacus]|uniref:uncharacterized protein LOC120189111 n=1 Tax=Hibiscus syriacus TaxID=106335 RepID=UPI0019205A6C|nr:uncharacterized protein LOC120189111 [Hibiscus syriacus]